MNGIDTIDIISRMKLGASDSEIASSLKVKVAEIRDIRNKASEQGLIPVKFRPPKPRVTHEERRQRHKQIVEWLAKDESRTKEQAAAHFGLNVRTISMIVQQVRGKPAPSKLSHKDTFRAAAMFVMNKSNSDIGSFCTSPSPA